MMDYGDGREERMAAFDEEMRLRRDPEVMRRREEYRRKVAAKKAEGGYMGRDAMIARLIEHNPAYIRSLLETEDDRFGAGALAGRYARTFWAETRAECPDPGTDTTDNGLQRPATA
jgi:hypothetical protein